jgi:uncharacterized protein (TIGR00299 family) protein
MKAVYFHTLCGASGDMILASLIDCGVPLEHLQQQMARTGIEGLSIQTERVERGGVSCQSMRLAWQTPKEYRHLPQILQIISAGGYSPRVVERCTQVLERVARAEAAVHGVPVDKVHFHEIGAVDTIIDVLGSCLCLEYLGVEQVLFSTLTEGHGTIQCDHGVMPVPAPATASLLQGFRLQTLDIPTEILTPTGAGLLTALGQQASGGPVGTVVRVGHGCGTKTFAQHPNYLRAVLLDTADTAGSGSDTIWVLESNLDHVSGEVMGFTAEELLRLGALDVCWTPVYMKKGRPGYLLAVQCSEQQRERLIDCIMANTRSLGVRYHQLARTVAGRRGQRQDFLGEQVDTKQCTWAGRTFTKIEYEACAALARQRKVPLVDVMDEFCRQSRG